MAFCEGGSGQSNMRNEQGHGAAATGPGPACVTWRAPRGSAPDRHQPAGPADIDIERIVNGLNPGGVLVTFVVLVVVVLVVVIDVT